LEEKSWLQKCLALQLRLRCQFQVCAKSEASTGALAVSVPLLAVSVVPNAAEFGVVEPMAGGVSVVAPSSAWSDGGRGGEVGG
jgi:hypothetical protein